MFVVMLVSSSRLLFSLVQSIVITVCFKSWMVFLQVNAANFKNDNLELGLFPFALYDTSFLSKSVCGIQGCQGCLWPQPCLLMAPFSSNQETILTAYFSISVPNQDCLYHLPPSSMQGRAAPALKETLLLFVSQHTFQVFLKRDWAQ